MTPSPAALQIHEAFCARDGSGGVRRGNVLTRAEQIRNQLPRGLRRVIESVYLHDAGVLSMHQNEGLFVVTLQPESDPGRLVVLGYTLVEDPLIEQKVLPAERCREPVAWLYDELDL